MVILIDEKLKEARRFGHMIGILPDRKKMS